jgi:processive 1,2-diacylglycerol beta-glucosyltransferase
MKGSAQKKILVISCTGGSGHIRAAEALKKTCDIYYPHIECQHLNLVDYSGWLLKLSMVHSYNFLVKHRPEIFRKLYYYANTQKGKNSLNKTAPFLKMSGKKIIEAVKRFNPDRIICTHFLPPVLLEELNLLCPIDIVVTDFYMHKIWNIPTTRTKFVASDYTKKNAPIHATNVLVSGIPIDPEFYKEKNNAVLKQKFHLTPHFPTVLVLSGGVCLVDPSESVRQILETFSKLNVVVISGKQNKKMYKKLCVLDAHTNNYQVIDFTKEIDEWMRVADVIITKPGGLTLSECLYLQKPLILINPIPGQEEENAKYILKNNFGYLAQTHTEVTAHLSSILNQTHALSLLPKTTWAAKTILEYI